jgi:hypothetical protein
VVLRRQFYCALQATCVALVSPLRCCAMRELIKIKLVKATVCSALVGIIAVLVAFLPLLALLATIALLVHKLPRNFRVPQRRSTMSAKHLTRQLAFLACWVCIAQARGSVPLLVCVDLGTTACAVRLSRNRLMASPVVRAMLVTSVSTAATLQHLCAM